MKADPTRSFPARASTHRRQAPLQAPRASIFFSLDDNDSFSNSTPDLSSKLDTLRSTRYEIFRHNAPSRKDSEDRTIMARTSG